MKKMFLIVLIAVISASVNAQFANSKWKSTLQLDNPVDVIFDFKSDTLEAIVVMDNSSLETMKYSTKDGILSIQKITGQSQCSSTTVAKYKYELKEKELYLTLVEDDCYDRYSVLDKTKWVKE